MMTEAEMMDRLERLVDGDDLASVVEALARVCCEKAAHIAENWQDAALAKQWDYASRVLERASIHKSVRAVS